VEYTDYLILKVILIGVAALLYQFWEAVNGR
jgi:hypothetical protein